MLDYLCTVANASCNGVTGQVERDQPRAFKTKLEYGLKASYLILEEVNINKSRVVFQAFNGFYLVKTNIDT